MLDQPLWLQAAAPAVGLLVAAACIRAGGRRLSPATSDEYIRAFHDPGGGMDLRAVPYRLAAAIATLGSGGPLGYEGPALYTGAGIGAALQRRLRRYFTAEDTKVLLVAGAAAGVAPSSRRRSPVSSSRWRCHTRRTSLGGCSCPPPSARPPAT